MHLSKCSVIARALILVALCVVARTAISDTAQDIYAKSADSVVTIKTYDECLFPTEQGSGVIIKASKERGAYILTNYHVVHRAGLVVVHMKSGDKCLASLCYFDSPSDVALLGIGRQITSPVPLPAPVVEIGSQAFAIGTPMGLGWTISNGIVSSLRTVNGVELVQFTAPVSNGSSGGPLFDAKGDLIGITTFNIRESENLNFALRIKPQTLADMEKRFWGGAFWGGAGGLINEVHESEWCLGHFEKDQSWMEHSEKAKSWKAHSNLIEDLEKRADALLHSMSDAEIQSGAEEFSDSYGLKRPVHDPLNILSRRIDDAYGNRFQDFPEDWRGWRAALNWARDAEDREAISKLVVTGIAKWPHRYEVVNDVWFELSHEKQIQFLEAIAESIPSKEDIASLESSDKPISGTVVINGKVNLKMLLGSLRPKLKLLSSLKLPEFADRLAAIKRILIAKGWDEKSP